MYIAFAVGELEASRYVDVIGLSTSSAHEAVNNAAAAVAKRRAGACICALRKPRVFLGAGGERILQKLRLPQGARR